MWEGEKGARGMCNYNVDCACGRQVAVEKEGSYKCKSEFVKGYANFFFFFG